MDSKGCAGQRRLFVAAAAVGVAAVAYALFRRSAAVRRHGGVPPLAQSDAVPYGGRQWKQVAAASPVSGRALALTVMTYNVLGDGRRYALSEKHRAYCPVRLLEWRHRGKALVKELLAANADVVGLQEVQASTFEHTFSKIPTYLGTQRPQPNPQFHDKTEAMLVKDGGPWVPVVASTRNVAFRDFAIPWLNDAPKMQEALMSRLDGAIFRLLRHRDTRQLFAFCTTHLYWNPLHPDLKVIQAFVLTQQFNSYLAAMAKTHAGGNVDAIPFVVSGDFNSLPTSGVYQLLTGGSVPTSHPHHPTHGRAPGMDTLTSALPRLMDSHLAHGGLHRVPFTTKTATWSGTIDYVFLSPGLQVEAVLELPYDVEQPDEYGPLPDVHGQFSSDHLAVGVRVTMPVTPRMTSGKATVLD